MPGHLDEKGRDGCSFQEHGAPSLRLRLLQEDNAVTGGWRGGGKGGGGGSDAGSSGGEGWR